MKTGEQSQYDSNWYKSDVTITITAGTDTGSGAYKLRYSTGGDYTVETLTSQEITISSTGTITAYTLDKAGNESSIAGTKTVSIDKAAPIRAELQAGTVTENTIAVTATGEDNVGGSGIYRYTFQKSITSSTEGFDTGVTQASNTYTYEGLNAGTTYYIRVVAIDKAGNAYVGETITQDTKTGEIILPDTTTPAGYGEIGKYVNYVSTVGTYPRDTLGQYSGNSSNIEIKTDTDLKWRIWSVDSTTLTLISDKPATNGGSTSYPGDLMLTSYLGYNNGITLLDEICKTCYSNGTWATSRSIDIDDILSVTNIINANASDYGTKVVRVRMEPPYIWKNKEQSSPIDNRSFAYPLTLASKDTSDVYDMTFSLWQNSNATINNSAPWKYNSDAYQNMVK